MFCRMCGRQIDQNAAYCPYCGTKTEYEGISDQQNPVSPVIPYEPQPYAGPAMRPMKRGMFIMLTGLGSLIALLAGIGAGMGLRILF